jgi:uncharacterized membrane protein HdeD (DUF308 family)
MNSLHRVRKTKLRKTKLSLLRITFPSQRSPNIAAAQSVIREILGMPLVADRRRVMDNRQGNLNGVIFLLVWWAIAQQSQLASGEAFLAALVVTPCGLISCHLFISALRRKSRGSMALAELLFWAAAFLCLAPLPMPERFTVGAMVAVGLITTGFACRMLDKYLPAIRKYIIAKRYWIAFWGIIGAALAAWQSGDSWAVIVARVLQTAFFVIPVACGWILGSSASRKRGDARVGQSKDFKKAGVSDDR